VSSRSRRHGPEGAQYLNPSAKALWAKSLEPSDRILITGATGWFGQTAVFLSRGLPQQVMLTASRAREIRLVGKSLAILDWDEIAVRNFAPTVVVDCAFLTRDRVDESDINSYIRVNRQLNGQLLLTAALPSVKKVVTISSGAAVFPRDAAEGIIRDNPYGFLKREVENDLRTLARVTGISVAVARAWSVSGAFVGKPRSYALTDMILQATQGTIHISARSQVYRRYVAVEELLALALAETHSPGFTVVDSEGQLVEMQELAELVRTTVNPNATITMEAADGSEASLYYSRSSAWQGLSQTHGLELSSLPEQINRAFSGLQLSEDANNARP
jgi:nucleoside-diphosphate-sugar epimerase